MSDGVFVLSVDACRTADGKEVRINPPPPKPSSPPLGWRWVLLFDQLVLFVGLLYGADTSASHLRLVGLGLIFHLSPRR
jgi:hypothetical protein